VLIPAASLCIPDQYWFKNLKARLVRSGQVRSGQVRSDQICCCASKEKRISNQSPKKERKRRS